MGFVSPKTISLGGPILAHCTMQISICHILLSRLTIEEESSIDFTKKKHGCLVTSNGLPANDFLYLLSETVINVILTKFVCCADSDLQYISKLSPFYLASHTHYPMPTML